MVTQLQGFMKPALALLCLLNSLAASAQEVPPPAPPPPAEAEVTVEQSPPPPRVEVQPVRPYRGWAWVPGHWTWSGLAWEWIPGAWLAPPRPGLVVVAPRWVARGPRWVFVRGGWAPRGTVRVVVPLGYRPHPWRHWHGPPRARVRAGVSFRW
jgi:hypothetical protein